MRAAIVIPAYNEAECVTVLTRMVLEVIAQQDFILFVDDGSTDGTAGYLRQLRIIYPQRVKVLTLDHNRGHQAALLAGLLAVKGKCDVAITMDADGQHDPRSIGRLIAAHLDGADIVCGVRRRNPSYASRLFYWSMGNSLVPNHGDYRLVSAAALDLLTEDSPPFLRGLFADTSFKTAIIDYDERPRIAGRPTYSLSKRVGLAWAAVRWRWQKSFLSF